MLADDAVELLTHARRYLDFGGSVTLHFVASGAIVLEKAREAFPIWRQALENVAKHGNAVLISFLRATPRFFAEIASLKRRKDLVAVVAKVIGLVGI